MLRPGQTLPDEVLLYGLQEVQENGSELYKASFLMNAYRESGRVNSYLDGAIELSNPVSDFSMS